jgi:hypothetical protein
MTAEERLLAIEEIKKLKARYFRYLDTKNWVALESVFAPDAAFDMRSGRGDMLDPDALLAGAVAIVSFIRASVEDVVTVHHGHMPEVDIRSDTKADGIWAMEDVLRWPTTSTGPIQTLHGYGHYHETYELISGGWRIKTLKLTRLRVLME